jgi:hypothetical protein
MADAIYEFAIDDGTLSKEGHISAQPSPGLSQVQVGPKGLTVENAQQLRHKNGRSKRAKLLNEPSDALVIKEVDEESPTKLR